MNNTAAKLAAVAIYGATVAVATTQPAAQATATILAASTAQVAAKRNSGED